MRIKNLKNILLLTVLVAIIAPIGSANACRFQAREFDVLFSEAEKVFIGTVMKIEQGRVEFLVERTFKNVTSGERYITEQGSSSCHVQFLENQQWLFLGPTLMSGTRILEDENGVIQQFNTDFVEQHFGPQYDRLPKDLPPQGPPNEQEPAACTMEAKRCSDGSYVSRAGPYCEFAACPQEQ